MSLDSYAFAVPKGTDLETVKKLWENGEVEILHHWDNNYHLHSSVERLWEMHTYDEFKYNEETQQGARMTEFTEQFFRFHKNDLIALKRWYKINHYDEIADLNGDLDFFEFGQILANNLDVYYVSSN